MAVQRDTPYPGFNFRVTIDRIGGGDPLSIPAGFQEVSGLGIEVTMAEYRNGNEVENHTRKVPTTYKSGDVTFKRGVIGVTDFFAWIKATREGDQTIRSQVTVDLMDEAHTQPVMTWKLTNARPMKYTAPSFNAKTASDVAVEELVLSIEKLDIE